jgi:hypothetical protein
MSASVMRYLSECDFDCPGLEVRIVRIEVKELDGSVIKRIHL